MKEYQIEVRLGIESIFITANNANEAIKQAKEAIANNYGDDLAESAEYSIHA